MPASAIDATAIDTLAGPLAVVAHDAGAANLIIAWLRDSDRPVAAFMAGPAEKLWREQLGDRPLLPSIAAALDGAATLVSGTGWSSDVEHDARVVASARGITSIAVIDHWVNFPMRFERDGTTQLPDMIVVSDDWAAAEARRCFARVPVAIWPNRYLDRQLEDIPPVPTDGDLLYICEPARSDWGRGVEGEFQAIDYLMAMRPHLDLPEMTPIRLRLHPSETQGKYDRFTARYPYMRADDSGPLASAIGKARWVAGMGSAALVVALASGRRVIGTLPPWAPACPLPHDGIVHLRDLEGAS